MIQSRTKSPFLFSVGDVVTENAQADYGMAIIPPPAIDEADRGQGSDHVARGAGPDRDLDRAWSCPLVVTWQCGGRGMDQRHGVNDRGRGRACPRVKRQGTDHAQRGAAWTGLRGPGPSDGVGEMNGLLKRWTGAGPAHCRANSAEECDHGTDHDRLYAWTETEV